MNLNKSWTETRQNLNRSLIEIFIEFYEIKISRSDFRPKLMCVCWVSFLTILDIYKAYFKCRHIIEYIENTCKKLSSVLFSLQKVTASFVPQGFVTKYFLIFVIDEVKNFAVNNIFKLLELVTYWELCIFGQSRTKIRAKGRRSYIEEFRSFEVVEDFCCNFIYRDCRVRGQRFCTTSETSLY